MEFQDKNLNDTEVNEIIDNTEKPRKKAGFLGGFLAGMGVVLLAVLILVVAAGIRSRFIWPGAAAEPIHEDTSTGEDLTISGDSTLSNVLNQETIDKMELIMKYINYYYLHDYDVKDLPDEVIRGLVDGLGDPYTQYFTPEEAQAMYDSLSGEFSGIGVEFQQDYNTMITTVNRVFEDSPAEKAGIEQGDILYKVDGEDVSTMDLNLTVTRIKGEKDTAVDITVVRKGNEMTFTCIRDEIHVETVESEILEDNIGYLSISSFESVTYDQFKDQLKDITDKGIKGLIIDLRNNGGGDVDITVKMLDEMLPEGLALKAVYGDGEEDEYTTTGNDEYGVPVVILINGGTASASEIFTGALRDRLNASVVGTTSFGKGVIQSLIDLKDGSMIKLTVCEYFTPNGYEVDGKGIDPDIEVTDDPDTEVDEQLLEAIREINNRTGE